MDNTEREMWKKIGVQVIDGDEVGYRRAAKFYGELGWDVSTHAYLIYDGKVYVRKTGESKCRTTAT